MLERLEPLLTGGDGEDAGDTVVTIALGRRSGLLVGEIGENFLYPGFAFPGARSSTVTVPISISTQQSYFVAFGEDEGAVRNNRRFDLLVRLGVDDSDLIRLGAPDLPFIEPGDKLDPGGTGAEDRIWISLVAKGVLHKGEIVFIALRLPV